jgi:hypothetical protein
MKTINLQCQLRKLALGAGMVCLLCGSARATIVFHENFNAYTGGNQDAIQFGTGLKVSYGGNLSAWRKAPTGVTSDGRVIPAVDLNGTGNYAIMLRQDQVITLANGIEANEAGMEYTVEFAGGPSVYAQEDQATAAGDGLVIDVLRSDESVLATYTYEPGVWTNVMALTPASFKYAGDGSGPVRLRLRSLFQTSRFGGAIDDLKVTSDVVLAEDFNSYTGGNQNATQFQTGLKVSFGGNLPGWTKAGDGAIHAVDLNGSGNYAPMFWQNNVITLASGIAANELGIVYVVGFWAAPAVYADGSQATTASDGMVFDVLRPDSSVLKSYTHKPGAWAKAETFAAGSFTYIGDGRGPVRLRVGPLAASGHFAGALENLNVSVGGAATAPSITTQPVGGTVVEGGDFTFNVEATGATTYQWRKGGAPIPGATNASLTLSNVKKTDLGTYSVVVGNLVGSVTSDDAALTVTPAPTFATYREAVLADNPIHYYPLDDTAGTVAADLGSLATTGGTYAGGITLGHPSATPRLGACAWFNGAPGTLVDLGLFHPGDTVTAEAWANLDPTVTSTYSIVLARWDGSYEIDFSPGDYVNWNIRNDQNGFGQAASGQPAARGQWHHIVGVFSQGWLTLYVDGIKGGGGGQGEIQIGGVLRDAGPSPDRVMIGATRSGTASSFNWKGYLDEVAIYDHALSADQIRGHYRAAQSGTPSVVVQNSVTITWPNFPPGYLLQWAGNVDGPYESYTGPIFTQGNNFMAPVTLGPAQKFFRLFQP